MRTLEKILIVFLNLLCRTMDVTPQRLNEIREQQNGPQRLEDRADVLEV